MIMEVVDYKMGVFEENDQVNMLRGLWIPVDQQHSRGIPR